MPGIAELYVETANNHIAKHIANNTTHKIQRADIDWLILTALDASSLGPSYKFAWYDAILHSKNFDIYWLGQKSAHKLPDSAVLPYIPNKTLQEFEVTVASASDDSSEDGNNVEEANQSNLEQSQNAEDTKKQANLSYDSSATNPLLVNNDSDATGIADVTEPLDPAYRPKSKRRQGSKKRAYVKKTPVTPRVRAGLKALTHAGTDLGISPVQGFVPYIPNNTPTAATPVKARKTRKAKKVTTPRAKRAPKLTAKAKAAAATTQASMEQNAQNLIPAQPELLPPSKGAVDPALEAHTIEVAADGVGGAEGHQSLFGDGNPGLIGTKPGTGQEFATQVAEEAAKLAARTFGLMS